MAVEAALPAMRVRARMVFAEVLTYREHIETRCVNSKEGYESVSSFFISLHVMVVRNFMRRPKRDSVLWVLASFGP